VFGVLFLSIGTLLVNVSLLFAFCPKLLCVAAVLAQKMAECRIALTVFKGRTALRGMQVKSCHLASSRTSCIAGIYRRHTIRMQRAVHNCLAAHTRLNRYQHTVARKAAVHTTSYQRRNHQTVPRTGWSQHFSQQKQVNIHACLILTTELKVVSAT